MPEILKQIDLIVWAPFPAPSVFEVDDFGLVPRSSAFGAMEIKRSNYSGVDSQLEEFVKTGPGLIATGETNSPARVMSVICVIEEKPSSRLQTLFANGSVVALFDKSSSEVALRPKRHPAPYKFSSPCCPLLLQAGDACPAVAYFGRLNILEREGFRYGPARCRRDFLPRT